LQTDVRQDPNTALRDLKPLRN